jgi:hypothetical protein
MRHWVLKCYGTYAQHGDENQYTPIRFLRELPVGARQRKPRCGIPFGVAFLNGGISDVGLGFSIVGKDGESPIQLADLLGSHEAP